MNYNKLNRAGTTLMRVIAAGLLLSLPVATSATPVPSDSCSGIGCEESSQGIVFGQQISSSLLSQLPSSEPQSGTGEDFRLENEWIGRTTLNEGTASIKLNNQTGDIVVFRVTAGSYSGGYPQVTMGEIVAGAEVTLHNLEAPFCITPIHRNGLFMQVTPQINSSNLVEVTLTDSTTTDNINLVAGTLSVQEDGNAYLGEHLTVHPNSPCLYYLN